MKTRNSAEPYVLFVGRLERLKGLQTVLPVFKNLKLKLKIAGRGAFANKLEHFTAGSSSIEFLGHQSEENLAVLYRNALALLLPSICYENGATVVLEAFQQKTPALVRNIGGMVEAVLENDAGFAFNSNKELETQLLHLQLNPEERDRLGRNGFRAVQKTYSAETHIERYLNLIHHLKKR